MFDEATPTPIPTPKPQKVVDMFEGESSQQSAVSSQQTPLMQPPKMQTPDARLQTPVATPLSRQPAIPLEEGPSRSSFGMVKVVLLVIFVLVLIGGAGYAAYRIMSQEPIDEPDVETAGSDVSEPAGTDEEDGETAGSDVSEVKPTFLDSDGDGLTNAEELEAGTKSTNPDTDSDGLGDREEVKVYGTDPRDEDTDGDGFLDGGEVAGGYNPNGEGKLFNVPTQ